MVDDDTIRGRVMYIGEEINAMLDDLYGLRNETKKLQDENTNLNDELARYKMQCERYEKRLMPEDWARMLGECVDLAGGFHGEAWSPERALEIIRDALDELADLQHEVKALRDENEKLRECKMPPLWAGYLCDLYKAATGKSTLCLKVDEAVDAIMDVLKNRLMPEGMEWPKFEDGKPVRLGDGTYVLGEIDTISFSKPGQSEISSGRFSMPVADGERVKRPEPPTTPSQECRDTVAPDSWERLEEDAKDADYYGHGDGACAELVRRAKALATGADVVRPGEVV